MRGGWLQCGTPGSPQPPQSTPNVVVAPQAAPCIPTISDVDPYPGTQLGGGASGPNVPPLSIIFSPFATPSDFWKNIFLLLYGLKAYVIKTQKTLWQIFGEMPPSDFWLVASLPKKGLMQFRILEYVSMNNGSDCESEKKTFFKNFFSIKNVMLQKMICFGINVIIARSESEQFFLLLFQGD